MPRLITSPQVTWSGKGPSRSPSRPPYLIGSFPKQKQLRPRISDTLAPQGHKRRRERDSSEVTGGDPEKTEGQYHSHQHWCKWDVGTCSWNLAAKPGRRSLRGPGVCVRSLQGGSCRGSGGESQESQAVHRQMWLTLSPEVYKQKYLLGGLTVSELQTS